MFAARGAGCYISRLSVSQDCRREHVVVVDFSAWRSRQTSSIKPYESRTASVCRRWRSSQSVHTRSYRRSRWPPSSWPRWSWSISDALARPTHDRQSIERDSAAASWRDSPSRWSSSRLSTRSNFRDHFERHTGSVFSCFVYILCSCSGVKARHQHKPP